MTFRRGVIATANTLPNVCSGSLADFAVALPNVRFTTECVAKLFAKRGTSNYRIRLKGEDCFHRPDNGHDADDAGNGCRLSTRHGSGSRRPGENANLS
jgi:hypothetical protein